MKECFYCHKPVEMEFIGRRDECPACGSDLHVCLNCEFYEEGRHNSCRETKADLVKEKDRSNFCDYFRFREQSAETKKTGREEAEKLWKELFKK